MKGINNGKGTTLGRQFRVARKGNVFLLDEIEWLTRLSCSWMTAVGGISSNKKRNFLRENMG